MRKPIQVIHAQQLRRLLNRECRAWRGRTIKPVVFERCAWPTGDPVYSVWLLDYSIGVDLQCKKSGWHSIGIPWCDKSVVPMGPCTYKEAMDAVKHILWKGRKNKKRIIERWERANAHLESAVGLKDQIKREREQNRKGETPMAKAKKKKVAAKKKATVARGNVGRTTKLNIREGWFHIFRTNAKATRAKRMTDEQIAKWMRKEFNSDAAYFDRPSGPRSIYNKEVSERNIPGKRSVAFDSDGNETKTRAPRAAKPKSKATAKKKKRGAVAAKRKGPKARKKRARATT